MSNELDAQNKCEENIHNAHIQSTLDVSFEGAISQGWLVSEVLRRPEDDTRDAGRLPIFYDGVGSWK